MIKPSPYLSFWQVAEKWSRELKCPVMDVIMDMKRDATYPVPSFPSDPPPPLLIMPIRFFSPQGHLDRYTAFRATNTSGPYYYWTEAYVAGLLFLNSGECPAEVTDEIKNQLSQFGIRREDFEKWCSDSGRPLPEFWGHNSNRVDTEANASPINGLSAEEYIAKCHSDGIPEATIAINLRDNYHLLNHKIASLLGRDKGLNDRQRMALKQRGQRLCKDGEKLRDQEK